MRCGKPEPIVVMLFTAGGWLPYRARFSRSTVPWCTTLPLALTVPLSTLVTNRSAMLPKLAEVMSHGPLMPLPEMVSRT